MAIVLFLIIMVPIFIFLIRTLINETIIYSHVVSYAIFSDRDFSLGRTIVEKRGLGNKRLKQRDMQVLEDQLRMQFHANRVIILNAFSLKVLYNSADSVNRINNNNIRKAGPKLMK